MDESARHTPGVSRITATSALDSFMLITRADVPTPVVDIVFDTHGAQLMSEPVGDDLAITAVPSPGATVLMVTGSLDWRTAGTLRRAVGDHVADGRTRLVLDLGGLDFCDAAGLGALVAALRTTRNAGGWLRLARAGPRIVRLLGITGLDDILPVHHGVTEAIGCDPAPAGLGAMR